MMKRICSKLLWLIINSKKSLPKIITQVESKGRFTIKEESADVSMEEHKIDLPSEPSHNELEG
jgi:hypothetical protein